MMPDRQVNLLYVAGWGRSGSTLLGTVLGQIPGFFCAGELRHVWQRSFLENWPCGCGEAFGTCPTWTAVVRESFGDPSDALAERLAGWTKRFRTRDMPGMVASFRRLPARGWRAEYLADLGKFYQGISRATGCRVIIDTSKIPSYGYALRLLPALKVHVVHLLRDPRAVAYSWWRRNKPNPRIDGERLMKRISPVTCTLLWNVWNLGTEALLSRSSYRYVRVRFEDFLASPARSSRAILSSLDLDGGENLPFVSDREVDLRPTHTVSGNPLRFTTGRVTLRPDERWRTGLTWGEKARVTALAWPLMLRYGYPLEKRRSESE